MQHLYAVALVYVCLFKAHLLCYRYNIVWDTFTFTFDQDLHFEIANWPNHQPYKVDFQIVNILITCIILFYLYTVETQSKFPVQSYAEIDSKINEGTRNRTIASTNMNATSR